MDSADWKLPKGDWDQCPDPLFGRDIGPILPSVSSGIFHPAARLSSWILDLMISVALRLYPNRLQVLRGLCRR